MINKVELIAGIQQGLLSDLETIINIDTVNDIGLIAEKLDRELVRIVQDTFIEISPLCISNSQKVIGDIFSLIIDDKRFILIVQQALLNPSKIEIGIINRDFDLLITNNVEKSFQLLDCGRFTELIIHFPESISQKVDTNFIKETTEAIMATAYSWLETKVINLLGENYIVSQGIYDYLRTVFLNKSLVDEIWLFASFKDSGLYLIDRKIIEKVIKLLKPLSSKIGLSPIQILSEVLNKRLNFSDTGSFIVTQNNRTKNFELNKLDYSDNNTLFTHAEILIFGENAVTGIPIESEGNHKLVAGIPVKYKNDIEPIILAHRDQIRNEFRLINSRLARFSKSILNTKSNINIGKLGEFVGGIMKSFIE